jgi:hypothetical protein
MSSTLSLEAFPTREAATIGHAEDL